MRHAWQVGITEMAGLFGWQSYFAGWLVNAFAQVVLFALLAELIDEPDHTRYMLIGNAIAVGTFPANGSIAASTWDRSDGTYPLLVIAPGSIVPGIIGRTIVWLAVGTGTSLLCLGLVMVVFGLDTPWPASLLLIPMVFLTMSSSYTMGLFLGSVVTRFPRARNILSQWMRILLLGFAGVTVPVSYWPESIEVISNVLPLTHGLEASRLLLDGGPADDIAWKAMLGLLVSCSWLLLAVLTIDRMANAGRRDGSIEFVS